MRPHAEESVEMLNIKRGILSTLNLDMTATTESDVHGTCETKIVQEGKTVTRGIKRNCLDRISSNFFSEFLYGQGTCFYG